MQKELIRISPPYICSSCINGRFYLETANVADEIIAESACVVFREAVHAMAIFSCVLKLMIHVCSIVGGRKNACPSRWFLLLAVDGAQQPFRHS